jgi:hypothetical protein
VAPAAAAAATARAAQKLRYRADTPHARDWRRRRWRWRRHRRRGRCRRGGSFVTATSGCSRSRRHLLFLLHPDIITQDLSQRAPLGSHAVVR